MAGEVCLLVLLQASSDGRMYSWLGDGTHRLVVLSLQAESFN